MKKKEWTLEENTKVLKDAKVRNIMYNILSAKGC